MTGIYMILNKVNNKIYIGQAKNLTTRLSSHKTELKGNYHHNKHLQNAWNKYGANNFEFKVIEYCDIDKLNEREMFWIKFYDKGNFSNLYNKTAGGEGLKNISSELRKKLSDAKKGKHLSEEHKRKIANSLKTCNRKHREWTDEQRLQASIRLKNRKPTIKQKTTASKLMKQRWSTEEWRNKMHDINSSDEHKQKCSGWKHTEQAKQKISEAGKRPCKQATKQKISDALKGRKLSEERISQISKINSGKIWVNNSVTSKMIYEYQLQEYINKGFTKGRIKWAQN